MSVEFLCECGHQLHAPNQNIGKRLRCPVCQVAVLIPEESTSTLAYEPRPESEAIGDSDVQSRDGGSTLPGLDTAVVNQISGTSVVVLGSVLVPWPGKTTLQVAGGYLIEKSSRPIAKHDRRSSIDAITGSGASVIGNPVLLMLGVLLLFVNGIGLLFLIPWLFVRHRVAYVYADRRTYAVRVKKSQFDSGHAFAEQCLGNAVTSGRVES